MINCSWFRNPVAGIACLACLFGIHTSGAEPSQRFSARDDIELTQFGDVYSGIREALVTSPSADLVVVHTTRESLKDNRQHDELRIYSVPEIRNFVNAPPGLRRLDPIWTIAESTGSEDNNGPLISNIRWLNDGSGIAYLLRAASGNNSIYLARLGTRDVTRLTANGEDVLSFDIRDRRHFVFTVASRGYREQRNDDLDKPSWVGTGRFLEDLVFPEQQSGDVRRGELWAAEGGAPFKVMDRASGKAVILYEDGIDSLALSPNGREVVTIRPFENVPMSWEALFPPPFPEAADRLRGGYQDLCARFGWYVGDYVRIELSSGRVTSLTNAPAAVRTGWWEEGSAKPAWSSDGSSVLLPGSFVANQIKSEVRPCVLVVRVHYGSTECVRALRRNLGNAEEGGYDPLSQVSFVGQFNDRVELTGSLHLNGKVHPVIYARSANGRWEVEKAPSATDSTDSLDLRVQETFKDPPMLVATDQANGKTRTLFDPNPQLKNISFGNAELYGWVDDTGRQWHGILYKPVDFRQGTRYPLVIQNHGFSEDRFRPSGGFPSAFVAQELASAGIMVLQVRDCPERSSPDEGPCNVLGYEAAVKTLSRAGMIDSSRLGIIGFSRTVFYVLEALTTSKLHFAAASITDGITGGYMDYLSSVGPNPMYTRDAEALMGSLPFGSGLEKWLKGSPDFHMDRVTTPLRIVATCGAGVLEMWEPYALLERMNTPVDLIILNTREHVITNPAVRLAAQGGNIDWFRYWLQDYEDPDPSKLKQYLRWNKLRTVGTSLSRQPAGTGS